MDQSSIEFEEILITDTLTTVNTPMKVSGDVDKFLNPEKIPVLPEEI
jgi:hypothetical protein